MAITTNFTEVEKKFNDRYWADIDEFEDFWLRRISETSSDTNYYTDRNGIEKVIPPINHHPELKEYEVWIEGYAATGESSGASLLGNARARNFGQACHIVMCRDHLKFMEEENAPDYKPYSTPARWDYDPQRLSYWRCSLYWSEELAKKSFG